VHAVEKVPDPVKCHHWGPFNVRTQPDKMIAASELSDNTPNT
jgi:hypothetical protein